MRKHTTIGEDKFAALYTQWREADHHQLKNVVLCGSSGTGKTLVLAGWQFSRMNKLQMKFFLSGIQAKLFCEFSRFEMNQQRNGTLSSGYMVHVWTT